MQSKCVPKLKSILEVNKNLKALVEKSIEKAKEINPDKKQIQPKLWMNFIIL